MRQTGDKGLYLTMNKTTNNKNRCDKDAAAVISIELVKSIKS